MNSSSSSKIEIASHEEEEEDRLSNLPEFILCHILSFLLTEDAAKTSILSKKWKYLFLAVPKIHLDCWEDPTHIIAQRLMLCRTPSITEFRLRCCELPEASLVHIWLTTLVFRNVQVLDIELHSQSTSGIPKCSLSKHLVWESLVVLKLNGKQIVFKISESMFFPKLKVLNLKYVEMQSMSHTYRFTEEGYPLLEDLRLEQLTLKRNQDHKPVLLISSSTLKRLIANYLDKELCQMDVHATQLQRLKVQIFGACPEMQINICNLECIESVCFKQDDECGQRFTKWFSKVNNARELDVLGKAAEGLVECVPMPQFLNLTRLKISTMAVQSMWNLVQHSPNLEVLHIQAYSMNNITYTFSCCCPHPENAPPCFAKTLRVITIRSSGESEIEVEALRFILRHGAVLQKLTVYYWDQREWSLPTAMKLLKQKRLSPDCEVELLRR